MLHITISYDFLRVISQQRGVQLPCYFREWQYSSIETNAQVTASGVAACSRYALTTSPKNKAQISLFRGSKFGWSCESISLTCGDPRSCYLGVYFYGIVLPLLEITGCQRPASQRNDLADLTKCSQIWANSEAEENLVKSVKSARHDAGSQKAVIFGNGSTIPQKQTPQ